MFEFPPDDEAHPKHLLERLLKEHEEFAEIAGMEPKIAVIFRLETQQRQGRMVLGTCYMPQVQGELRGLFEVLLTERLGFWPDFLIVLSKPFWMMVTDLDREALMHHEMRHMGQQTDKYGTPRFNLQTGEPVFGIIGHDIEAFDSEVRRYGRWKSDIGSFLDAAAAGISAPGAATTG